MAVALTEDIVRSITFAQNLNIENSSFLVAVLLGARLYDLD